MIKYSIIMPVYNVENYLERSIDSVINQTYTNWELLLVNDGSNDKSGEICDFYASRYGNITVNHQKNSGSGIARQKAIDMSSGDYICFVDPDDFINKNALAELKNYIQKYEADIIAFGYTVIEKNKLGNIENNVNNYPKLISLTKNKFRSNYELIEYTSARALWNKIYKRSFLLKFNINFTNQRVGQDALFNYHAYRFVENILIVDKEYYNYDATRDGSAIKKYNLNKWNYEFNIAKEFEKLFISWNMFEEYREIIYRELWYAIFNQTMNLSVKTCPLSFFDKRENLKKIRNCTEINIMFANLKSKYVNKTLQNCLFFLLKYKQISLTLLVMKAYNTVFLKN